MRPYASLIAEKTSTTDPATLALIEELMRADRTSLDGLSPAEFTVAIAEALADARDLHASGQLTGYCKALGLAVPAAVAS